MLSPSFWQHTATLLSFSNLLVLSSAYYISPPSDSLISVKCAAEVGEIQYTRDAYWQGESFFDNFDFVTSEAYMQDPALNRPDPTNGFVNYQSKDTAVQMGLINTTDNGNPRWGVDTTNSYMPGKDWGRPSIRIESKRSWTHGLFVADIAHMPGSACGVWPAFWTLGSGPWPFNGEVDILEGINLGRNNQIVVHTSDNCTLTTPHGSSLAPIINNLDDASSPSINAGNCATNHSASGCRVPATTANNYGDAFNAQGGGIYAMQWTSDFLKVWFFPRGSIPPEVQAALDNGQATPDVSMFGLPEATFASGNGCEMDAHFKENRLIFDTTFCGDWASSAWPAKCPSVAGKKSRESCEIYVGAHPEEYEGAYWEINSITVFRESSGCGQV